MASMGPAAVALLATRQGCCATAWCVAAFTLIASPTVTHGAETLSAAVAAGPSRAEEPLREYRALRRMHAWNEKFNHEAWMDVWTELKAGRFNFEVVSERGSEVIRTKVLHALLNREQETINQGDSNKAELTPENYDFGQAGRDTDGSRYVEIKPRRKDSLLVDGRMVLTPDGGQLLRVEGRLAKNPSFWTSLVNIVRRYARLGGVQVPVSTESTAKIKFAGTAQLQVSYEYQTVNGRSVNLSASR
jgi:hypothetical protein